MESEGVSSAITNAWRTSLPFRELVVHWRLEQIVSFQKKSLFKKMKAMQTIVEYSRKSPNPVALKVPVSNYT